MKYNLKKPLNQYNLKTRQGLMARLSEIAYQDLWLVRFKWPG